MKIGIIGLGVVGEAVEHGLKRIGHEVRGFDLKRPETSLADVLDADVVFVCVPTPKQADGSCDTSIVERVVRDLEHAAYAGLVTIKSTVIPGTTARLASTHTKLRLAFCPEFLRERAAVVDFSENHDVCVIGTNTPSDYSLLVQAHGSLPRCFRQVSPTEAELCKYFSNVFNALRVTFANEFYEVCIALGANYDAVKEAMIRRDNIADAYLNCNANTRGFGGVCLPKDTAAFAAFVRSLGLDLALFDVVVEENAKFKMTVPAGMRST